MRVLRNAFAALLLLSALPCTHAQAAEADLCQIRVTTSPDGAEVVLDGKRRGKTPTLLQDLLPGRHLLEVELAGYHPQRRTVQLTPGQRVSEELQLEPILGLVLLHTEPQGAEVQVDGAHRGLTPLFLTDVALGAHRVKFSSRGYKDMEVDLVVQNSTPIHLSEALVSDSAQLKLTSTPPGALVRLGGVDKGTTPLTLDRIPSGRIILEITADGFEDWTQPLQVRAGEALPIHADLTPLPGQINVVSIPNEARVYLEDQFRGVTPFSLKDAAPGAYHVRVETLGYKPMSRTVRLTQAGSVTEEFRLERNSGILELITEPANVTVFMDGRALGTTQPGETDQVSEALRVDLLPVGEHLLQLTKKGYFESRIKVTIKNNETFAQHQKMKRRFIPDTIVQTRGLPDDSYRGVISKKFPNGDIELEIFDGVFRTIKFYNIVKQIPIVMETPEAPQE